MNRFEILFEGRTNVFADSTVKYGIENRKRVSLGLGAKHSITQMLCK